MAAFTAEGRVFWGGLGAIPRGSGAAGDGPFVPKFVIEGFVEGRGTERRVESRTRASPVLMSESWAIRFGDVVLDWPTYSIL